ncbi:hypothetical protein G9A89_004416 [Geosiphon pyriformis]|nr:hypothetical protein G9A89_004416 [Geosiphon pyriformis]
MLNNLDFDKKSPPKMSMSNHLPGKYLLENATTYQFLARMAKYAKQSFNLVERKHRLGDMGVETREEEGKQIITVFFKAPSFSYEWLMGLDKETPTQIYGKIQSRRVSSMLLAVFNRHKLAIIKKIATPMIVRKFDYEFIGHGTAGAIATFAAVQFRAKYGKLKVSLTTFGSPRIGNGYFADSVERGIIVYRVTHSNDWYPQFFANMSHIQPEYWIPGDDDCDCHNTDNVKVYECWSEISEIRDRVGHPECNAQFWLGDANLNKNVVYNRGPYFGYIMENYRSSEPTQLVVFRAFIMVLFLGLMLGYLSILLIDISGDNPVLKQSTRLVDSLPIPDGSSGNSCQDYISYDNSNGYSGMFVNPAGSLKAYPPTRKDQIYGIRFGVTVNSPKFDPNRPGVLVFQAYDGAVEFTRSLKEIIQPSALNSLGIPPKRKTEPWVNTVLITSPLSINDTSAYGTVTLLPQSFLVKALSSFALFGGAWGIAAAVYTAIFGTDSLRPFGCAQIFCCVFARKSSAHLRKTFPIIPLVSQTNFPSSQNTPQSQDPAFRHLEARFNALEMFLSEYIVDDSHLKKLRKLAANEEKSNTDQVPNIVELPYPNSDYSTSPYLPPPMETSESPPQHIYPVKQNYNIYPPQ